MSKTYFDRVSTVETHVEMILFNGFGRFFDSRFDTPECRNRVEIHVEIRRSVSKSALRCRNPVGVATCGIIDTATRGRSPRIRRSR